MTWVAGGFSHLCEASGSGDSILGLELGTSPDLSGVFSAQFREPDDLNVLDRILVRRDEAKQVSHVSRPGHNPRRLFLGG